MNDNIQILNPLQLNDWEFKKFFCAILSIQCAIWVLIGLSSFSLEILRLRQFICCIYLSFVPGIIILRILKSHKLGNETTLLYAIGLSITTLMFTGFSMNILYPYFGINMPISFIPLIFTINIVILILCLLSYVLDKEFSDPDFLKASLLLSPYSLLSLLLPMLSILGTYLVNYYNNNILLLLLLIIIAIIPILITLNKIPQNYYGLILLSISVSLLYHRSLISMNLWGWDIHIEYYFSKLVTDNSFWSSTFQSNVNSLLSITVLAPIYSLISNVSLTWIFKIIYPSLFSLTSLGLYQIYIKQVNEKIAFLAVFFFVSIFTFYNELSVLPRQEIAELFLVLAILVKFFDNQIKVTTSIIFLLFSMSLIVSHYAVSYIYLFSFILLWIFLFFRHNVADLISSSKISQRTHKIFNCLNFNSINPLHAFEASKITSASILIIFVFTMTWYMHVSSSSSFNTFVYMLNNIASNFFRDFLDPNIAQGMGVTLSATTSWSYMILKYLHITTQMFITFGIIILILNYNNFKFKIEYSILSLINYGICIAAFIVPYFALSLTVTRLYHLTTFFLAPFCIIGGILFFNCLIRIKSKKNQNISNSIKLLAVFLATFFLFNCGFIQEVTNSNPYSISLDNTLDYPRFNDKELYGAEWLIKNTNTSLIYADVFGRVLLTEYVSDIWKIRTFDSNTDKLPNDAYIYLRNLNVKGIIMRPAEKPSYEKPYDYIHSGESLFYTSVLSYKNKLYTNGGSDIYK